MFRLLELQQYAGLYGSCVIELVLKINWLDRLLNSYVMLVPFNDILGRPAKLYRQDDARARSRVAPEGGFGTTCWWD